MPDIFTGLLLLAIFLAIFAGGIFIVWCDKSLREEFKKMDEDMKKLEKTWKLRD